MIKPDKIPGSFTLGSSFLDRKSVALMIYFVLLLSSFWQYYFAGRVPFTSVDALITFNMNKEYIANLKSGNFATWFHNYNLGLNRAGWDPYACPFNLPNIVVALLPFDITATYIFMRQLTMALMGFFAYCLFKNLGFSSAWALLGGAVYMFNPMTDEHHYLGAWTYAYIFTPIGIMILRQWLKAKRRKFLFFLWSMLSAVLYLCGGMAPLQYVYLGVFLYALTMILVQRLGIKKIFSLTAFLLFSGIFALLISGYTFLPGVDTFLFKEHRIKNINISLFYFSQFSFPGFIKGLMSFIFPFESNVYLTDYSWAEPLRAIRLPGIDYFLGNYWNYLNILVLPAIILIFRYRKKFSREIKGLLCLAAAYYFIFLNPFLFNPDFIFRIFPFYTLTKNYPIFYMVLSILVITALKMLKDKEIVPEKRISGFFSGFSYFYFFLAVCFLGVCAAVNIIGICEAIGFLGENLGKKVVHFTYFPLMFIGIKYFFSSTATVSVLLLLIARGMQLSLLKRVGHKYFMLCVILFLTLEYACYTRLVYPFMDNKIMQYGQAKTQEDIFIHNLPENTRIAYQKKLYKSRLDKGPLAVQSLSGLDVESLRRAVNKNLPLDYFYLHVYPFDPKLAIFGVSNLGMTSDLDRYYTRLAGGNPLYEEQLKNNYDYVHTMLYSLNADSGLSRPVFSYLVTQNELFVPGLIKVLNGEYYNIYRNESALPRAYFVDQAIYEPDPDKALDILESRDFDWGQAAVVDNQRHVVEKPLGAGSQYSIQRLKVYYNNVEIVIHNRNNGILVLNDLFYPYWKAFDNGRPVEIFKVNTIFRGIKLAPGKHQVAMQFYDPMLTVGLWVSALSLLICAWGGIYCYLLEKKS